jgi:hypothetical protein
LKNVSKASQDLPPGKFISVPAAAFESQSRQKKSEELARQYLLSKQDEKGIGIPVIK